MKIKIKTDDVKFTLILPLAAIKTKLFWTAISNEDTNFDKKEMWLLSRKLYKVLKQCRKSYGKITLVDIKTKDGELVQIIV